MSSSMVWWSGFPETRISSTMFLIRNRPQPRGGCLPSSLASRSGLCAFGLGGGLPPRSMMRTKRRFSRSHTSILTGTSGMYLLPCSMAFIVASATAVLSLSRVLSGNPSPLTALATCSAARRSLPGSLGKLSSASVRRAPLLGAVTVPPIFPRSPGLYHPPHATTLCYPNELPSTPPRRSSSQNSPSAQLAIYGTRYCYIQRTVVSWKASSESFARIVLLKPHSPEPRRNADQDVLCFRTCMERPDNQSSTDPRFYSSRPAVASPYCSGGPWLMSPKKVGVTVVVVDLLLVSGLGHALGLELGRSLHLFAALLYRHLAPARVGDGFH